MVIIASSIAHGNECTTMILTESRKMEATLAVVNRFTETYSLGL